MHIMTLEVVPYEALLYFSICESFFLAMSIGHSFYFIIDKYINNEIIAKEV